MFTASDFKYRYAPLLTLRPSEMRALEELAEKAKDLTLPIIMLRGWVGSKRLENSIPRIKKAFGERRWILDIDASFLDDKKDSSGNFPREVFHEVESLLSPFNGYDNWVEYVKGIATAIPTLQLGEFSEISRQIDKLVSLGRGLVVKFDRTAMEKFSEVLEVLAQKAVEDLFVIFDYGQVDRDVLSRAATISALIQQTHSRLPAALIAICCSSFPSSFSGINKGEISIYERMLFNIVTTHLPAVSMIYSDTASARAERLGGGGIPSPRIDYPLKNQWRFIREEYSDPKEPDDEERINLYTEIAQEIKQAEYWISDLHVWGTQMIELTSKGEGVGIDSPTKATAVRINIHMHQQIYYNDTRAAFLDTDEDWTD